jgi:hypothetical protein
MWASEHEISAITVLVKIRYHLDLCASRRVHVCTTFGLGYKEEIERLHICPVEKPSFMKFDQLNAYKMESVLMLTNVVNISSYTYQFKLEYLTLT